MLTGRVLAGHRRGLLSGGSAAVLAAVVLGGLSALTGNTWLLLGSGAAVALLAHAVATRPDLRGVEVALPPRTRLVAKDEGVLRVLVRNTGRSAVGPVQVVLSRRLAPFAAALVGPLPAGGHAEVDLAVRADRREVVDDLDVLLLAADPLGLAGRFRTHALAGVVVTHPAPRRPVAVPRTGRGAPDGDGTARRGPGADLVGVRDWRRGDGSRHIHWRSTARHGRLVVAERGEPETTRWTVGLTAVSGSDVTEQLLARAAATCRVGLDAGVPLDVVAWVPAPPGSALVTGSAVHVLRAPVDSAPRLLDWFSALGTFGVPAPEDVLRAVPSSTTQLVLLDAPELDPAWWRRVETSARAAGASVHRVTP